MEATKDIAEINKGYHDVFSDLIRERAKLEDRLFAMTNPADEEHY